MMSWVSIEKVLTWMEGVSNVFVQIMFNNI